MIRVRPESPPGMYSYDDFFGMLGSGWVNVAERRAPYRPNPPRLLDRARQIIRAKHYSHSTESAYIQWIRRFVLFHLKRHPAEMAEPEINAFLTYLAIKKNISVSTQNQALSALLFLYRHVLSREIGDLGNIIRARKPKRLPVVMTRGEVKSVIDQLEGDGWLLSILMYGAGLRLIECLRLRVQDIDFPANQIIVRDGKGFKDRMTMLPMRAKHPLREHLKRVRRIHQHDLSEGFGRVQMPYALERKYTAASQNGLGNLSFPRHIAG